MCEICLLETLSGNKYKTNQYTDTKKLALVPSTRLQCIRQNVWENGTWPTDGFIYGTKLKSIQYKISKNQYVLI